MWRYPPIVIDGPSLTAATLFVATVLLLAGSRLARWISETPAGLLVRRLHVDDGAAAAIRTLVYYVLFVAFAVSALRIVHFPMTVCTVVGGAIGVGVGRQNVVSNFISGLILMLERPIRPGDYVEWRVRGASSSGSARGARASTRRTTPT